jgi:hypothetical protein
MDVCSVAPCPINVGGMEANAPESTQRHEADGPSAGQKIHRQCRQLRVRLKAQTERNPDVTAMHQAVGEWVDGPKQRRTDRLIGASTKIGNELSRRQLRSSPRQLINRTRQTSTANCQPQKSRGPIFHGADYVCGYRLDIPAGTQARHCQLRIIEALEHSRNLTSLFCDRGENKTTVHLRRCSLHNCGDPIRPGAYSIWTRYLVQITDVSRSPSDRVTVEAVFRRLALEQRRPDASRLGAAPQHCLAARCPAPAVGWVRPIYHSG